MLIEFESWGRAVTHLAVLDIIASSASLYASVYVAGVISDFIEMPPDMDAELAKEVEEDLIALQQSIACCLLFLFQIWIAFNLLLAARKVESNPRRSLLWAKKWQRLNVLAALLLYYPARIMGIGIGTNTFFLIRVLSSVVMQDFIGEIEDMFFYSRRSG